MFALVRVCAAPLYQGTGRLHSHVLAAFRCSFSLARRGLPLFRLVQTVANRVAPGRMSIEVATSLKAADLSEHLVFVYE
eukprot:6862787-Pyramimonas_sp.AAC.2